MFQGTFQYGWGRVREEVIGIKVRESKRWWVADHTGPRKKLEFYPE